MEEESLSRLAHQVRALQAGVHCAQG